MQERLHYLIRKHVDEKDGLFDATTGVYDGAEQVNL